MEMWSQVQTVVASALPGLCPEDIRIPARSSPCDCYLPHPPALSPETFGTLLDALLVKGIRFKNDRLLLDFTDAFYDALVNFANESLPLPDEDHGDFALNRMRLYARQGGCGCPKLLNLQRALWLCAGANTRSSIADQAGQAYIFAFRNLQPAMRQSLLLECGPFSAACARLYGVRYRSTAQR